MSQELLKSEIPRLQTILYNLHGGLNILEFKF